MFQTFSPNMLKTFKLCPKKFYFKYIKKISMPANDEIFELGKNIHALASYYLKKEYLDKLESSLNSREKEIWQYLKGIKYFSYETVNTEYNLAVKINDVFFGGRLDALVKNDGKYYILDYKTGSVPQNAKYDFQTMIYMLSVSKFFKTEDINFVYLDLKNKSEVVIQLTPNLIKEYEEKLIEVADKINNEDFYAKKSSACRCEYDVICYD